jgi:hypothetical protein
VNQIKAIAGIEVKAVKMVKCTSCAWHRSLINSMKSISYVERIDFANKTLNQTGRKIVKGLK